MSKMRMCVLVAMASLLCAALLTTFAAAGDDGSTGAGLEDTGSGANGSYAGRGIAETIWFQGFLADVDTGDPINGTVTVEAEIFDGPDAGVSVWGSETHNGVSVVEGWFNIELGSIESLPGFDTPPYYLELHVDGENMDARQKFASVPMAYNASDFDLPYNGTVSTPGTAFHVEQLGAGTGIYSRVGGSNPAIVGAHSASGVAIRGTSLSGTAGDFIGDVDVDGDLSVNHNLDVADDLDVTGSATVGDSLVVTGNATVGDTLDALAVECYNFKMTNNATDGYVLTADNSGQGWWLPSGAGASDGDWEVSGNDIYSAVTGNVGIGTTMPTHTLQVNGNAYFVDTNDATVLSAGSGGGDPSPVISFGEGSFLGSGMESGEEVVSIVAGLNASADADLIEAGHWVAGMPASIDHRFRVGMDGDVTCDGSFTGGGADLAEMVPVSGGAMFVEPGDVMVIDPTGRGETMMSSEARSTLVVGVYSTAPGFVASTRDWDNPTPEPGGEYRRYSMEEVASEFNEIPLAVVGIVPCKASAENGPIAVGDLLVTSGTPGHAMRDGSPAVGTVLGKALEPLAVGTGTINVLVTLQ